ncbi:MAG: AgmX/PglI C-terminal domain-containing protein [Labilithrix sp.]|nr:AgmX/PglI C-terminal domain-containing protein [Labilithrix sp.]
MNVRGGKLVISLLFAGGVAAACDPPSSEPPPQAPKSASRPPDRTEVTMEVSSAAPPGEVAPPASSGPASTAEPATDASDPSNSATIGGVQSDAAVEKAVAPVRPRLRACYKKALAAEPGIGGSATFDATIGKDGHVASARFVKREGLSEDMVGCLLVAVRAMTFDGGKKSQIVTLSFGDPPAAAAPVGADAGAKP